MFCGNSFDINLSVCTSISIYRSISPDSSNAVECLAQCLMETGSWMRTKCLRLNPEKIEVMLVVWGKQTDDMARLISAPLKEGVHPPFVMVFAQFGGCVGLPPAVGWSHSSSDEVGGLHCMSRVLWISAPWLRVCVRLKYKINYINCTYNFFAHKKILNKWRRPGLKKSYP